MADATCSVEGCTKGGTIRLGYCPMHYKRFKKYGDLNGRVRRPTGLICEVADCGKKARRWGLCADHSRQLRTHGDPTVRIYRGKGTGTIRPDGYVRFTIHGHPLASRRGMVYEHRIVLYDKIGPGSHPCHWCGRLVTWRNGQVGGDALVADHLDFNPSNNDPANLVPSCHPCNCVRHRPVEPCDCPCHQRRH